MSSFQKPHNICWVDVETTGLDAHRDSLLEIAVLITDHELNILDEAGFQAVVRHTLTEVGYLMSNAVPFVQDMHHKTGLWGRLSGPDALYLPEIDLDLSIYLARFGDAKTMPIAGNSVALDQNFITSYLPRVSRFLDYHMRDVSSVAGMVFDWYDFPWYDKANDHTAMTDIRESIKELKHYREIAFKSQADLETDLRIAKALEACHKMLDVKVAGSTEGETAMAAAGAVIKRILEGRD